MLSSRGSLAGSIGQFHVIGTMCVAMAMAVRRRTTNAYVSHTHHTHMIHGGCTVRFLNFNFEGQVDNLWLPMQSTVAADSDRQQSIAKHEAAYGGSMFEPGASYTMDRANRSML